MSKEESTDLSFEATLVTLNNNFENREGERDAITVGNSSVDQSEEEARKIASFIPLDLSPCIIGRSTFAFTITGLQKPANKNYPGKTRNSKLIVFRFYREPLLIPFVSSSPPPPRGGLF